MENSTNDVLKHVKGVIEALLFVNERPIVLEQMKRVLETVSTADIKKAVSELQNEYALKQSGINIIEIAGGYQMLTNSLYASYIRSFYKTRHKEKLSKPSLEVLAIIAYKQPVTRGEVELIRGVNSDGVVMNLIEKELIKIVGRKDIAGRPFLYGTTKQFMEYFGLRALEDLPKLEEFEKFAQDREKQVEEETKAIASENAESTTTEENPSETVNEVVNASTENIDNEEDAKEIKENES